MIPKRFVSDDGSTPMSWKELGAGAPTIIGLARLCSNALASGAASADGLSLEAKAILFAARQRGIIEIKGTNNAFDAVDRFLAVYVELDPDTGLVFRNKKDPVGTIRYLDAFRQLCGAGLVLHHLYGEFSLAYEGFRLANAIRREEVEQALSFGVELSRHEW